MIARIGLVLFALAPLLVAVADDPKQGELKKKPQWQRMLTGEDLNAANKLTKRIDETQLVDDYTTAIEAGEELLTLRKRVQGENHHAVVTLKHQLESLRKVAAASAEKRKGLRAAVRGAIEAQTLERAGRYLEAAPKLRAYHDACRELLGDDSPDTALAISKVAVNLSFQGKYDEADPLYRKALDIRIKAFGEDNPFTANSYSNLSGNLGSQGQFAESEQTILKALEIHRRVLGEENAETADSYNNVAVNLSTRGKYGEALQYLVQSLGIRRRVLGEDHADTAQSYQNLATNLKHLAKPAEAVPIHLKSLEIRRRLFGENHPKTAESYNGYGSGLHAVGRYAEARENLRMGLEINRKVWGENHPATAESYNNVAIVMDGEGDHAGAATFHRKALEIRRRVFGEDHAETALSYGNLAANLNDQEKYVEAEPYYQTALDIARRIHRDHHPDVAAKHSNKAFNLASQRKYDEAQPDYEKALEIALKLGMRDHSDTASYHNNLAVNLSALGRLAAAVPHFQRSLEIRRKVYGENHPDVVVGYKNLAFNRAAMGKPDEAREVLLKAIASFESSRMIAAKGLGRASLDEFNPRLVLAALQVPDRPVDAYRTVELSFARGLLDEMASNPETRLTAAERLDYAAARDRVAALQPQIFARMTREKPTSDDTKALADLIEQRRRADERLAALAAAVSQREVAPFEAIRAAIPADAALVFWVDVNSESGDVQEHWACAIRSTGDPKWERMPGTGVGGKWTEEDQLTPRILRYAFSISARDDEVRIVAKRVRAQRIDPLAKHLVGVKTLLVVPVEEMAGVPIEACAPEYRVSYFPSGTFLTRLKDRAKPAGNRLLALGDPVYESGGKKPVEAKRLPPGGLLVLNVVPMSVAAEANLKPGDVLLKYGDVELKDFDSLKTAIDANNKKPNIVVTIWREAVDKPLQREVAPGRLGVVIDPEPAPTAIANRRKTDALLARGGGDWDDLPGTRVESLRLRELFGDSAKVLLDGDAGESTLESLRKSGELATYRYLHFATHGHGNNAAAFESALILSQDKLPINAIPKAGEPAIDGRVSAREVLEHWKLDAELVTLSACESAVGKRGGGDGLLGFAQAFLTAGARSVCLSLWKVDDAATALLMNRFYENLLGKREGLTKPMAKAAALDEAKRWLRDLPADRALEMTAKIGNGVARGSRGKNVELKFKVDPKVPAKESKPFAHPIYWAAFILIGDPN